MKSQHKHSNNNTKKQSKKPVLTQHDGNNNKLQDACNKICKYTWSSYVRNYGQQNNFVT